MEKEGISFEHEVFLQQVWSSGIQRDTTTSLVLDVDVQAIDTATNFLLHHEFKGRFRMIKFHPFIKKGTVGQDIVKKLIELHNRYLHSTRKVFINGSQNLNSIIALKDGTNTSLPELVFSNLINKQRLVHSYTIQRGTLVCIYHERYETVIGTWAKSVRDKSNPW